jgi:hypothetical protein
VMLWVGDYPESRAARSTATPQAQPVGN